MATVVEATFFFAASCVLFWCAWIHIKTNAQRLEVAKKCAWISLQLGEGRLPSWSCEAAKISEFLFAIEKQVLQNGVPRQQLLEALAEDHFRLRQMMFAGALEVRRVSYAHQKLAVAESIVQRLAYDARMCAESKILFSDVAELFGRPMISSERSNR